MAASSRPKSSLGKISPLILALAIPALVLIFAVVVIVTRGGGRFGGIDAFPYSEYLHNPETLRGNTYLVRGKIESRLAYAEGKGSIIAVKLLSLGDGSVPVFVPEEPRRNLEVGQQFDIKVRIVRDTLVAEDMEKL